MITPLDIVKWAFAILLSSALLLAATLCLIFVISMVRELISSSPDEMDDVEEDKRAENNRTLIVR